MHVAMPNWAPPLLCAIAAALLVVAAAHDLAARTIPNRLCLGVAASGFGLRVADGGLIAGAGLAAGIFALGAVCWHRGWMGGGDVKLLAATALAVPPARVPAVLFAVGLAGAALALLYLGLQHLVRRASPVRAVLSGPAVSGAELLGPARPPHLLARILRAERFRLRRGFSMPYGVGIAAGGILVLMQRAP